MTSMTIHQKIQNTHEAIRLVQSVPSNKFTDGLVEWAKDTKLRRIADKLGMHSCGTSFCLGGWIARDEYFKNLGVHSLESGAPLMLDLDTFEYIGPSQVSHVLFGHVKDKYAPQLFGERNLFAPTTESELAIHGDEKSVIMYRLTNHLAALEADLAIEEATNVKSIQKQHEPVNAL